MTQKIETGGNRNHEIMAISRAKRLQIEHRQEQVAELSLKGLTQAAIAKELNVTQATISNDLKRIRELWRASTIRDFDLSIAIALQRVEIIQREAWSAWERSRKPAQSAILIGEGASQPTRKTLRNQNGDPRYLAIVLRCEEHRANLLGLAAPKRTQPLDDDQGPITISTLLKHIEKNPPSRPKSFDEKPPNVFDVEAACRELEKFAAEQQEADQRLK